MTDSQEQWGRVAEAITSRLLELGMTQADLVRQSGVSPETVRPLMKGAPGNYRPATLAKVAQALGWTADSIERIRNGEPPRTGNHIPLPPDPVADARRAIELDPRLTEAQRAAMLATFDAFTTGSHQSAK